jgi:hypothetical protein
MEDAQEAALDDERDAQQRADLLLVEQRVDGVARLEVVDGDGPPLCGDSSCESLTDGHAEANLDLFLEASCSSRRQLVRLLVEQQDRGGVDIEDLDDANEKRLEKPIELQVRKSRLGDPLEVARQTRGRSTGTTQNQEWYELRTGTPIGGPERGYCRGYAKRTTLIAPAIRQ